MCNKNLNYTYIHSASCYSSNILSRKVEFCLQWTGSCDENNNLLTFAQHYIPQGTNMYIKMFVYITEEIILTVLDNFRLGKLEAI